MILFNLTSMFIRHLSNRDSWVLYKTKPSFQIHSKESKLISKNVYTPNTSSMQVASNKSNSNYRVIQSFTNRQLTSPHLVARLINRYWQETIFLSTVNPFSDNYVNQLKSVGIAVYQNKYKKFLLDFSKALTTGRIEVSLDGSTFPNRAKMNSNYIKYVWRKGLNLSLPDHLWKFFSNKKHIYLSNNQKSVLVKKIKDNDFPIFTVINGFNQIVMAESSEEVLNNKSVLDRLYQWYYNYFLWKKNNRSIYEGLFFINPEDATEYRDYIAQRYPQSSKQNRLHIFTSKLELYYELTRTIIPRVQFRLIPDLTELGELISKYRKYKHINFHHQQKYGSNYFQGQPIYLIQPVFAFNKKFKKVMPVKYQYKLSKAKDQKPYEAIFMNYKTALLAWQKFRKQTTNYNLPLYPQILVYNLEDFIKTCENNKQIYRRDILFIPDKKSYHFLKQRHEKQSQIHIWHKFSSSLLYLQVFGKRILWSLTSRQPMSW